MKNTVVVLWSLMAVALAIPLDPDAQICQAFCEGACPEGWTKKANDTGAGAAQACASGTGAWCCQRFLHFPPQ
ncbi:hypothetical protein JMJ77_0006328 [Colletotrichum scovillei]|uniref:Uncharacterized protein n=1 Tax=Colletotrichum scovillei TaxID=1209932 RepID=A0A9P7UI71_9PEZI|nr:hypothetical protein JMJ77_0006328 [Colletotrichum scovillei]KAG7077610.1 hypothetical protein JMJ76_0014855 [Colletotrichum scovillei]KAG7084777.1 hypothetical protein JMJ78_0010209 [Colletotrichum scovillei]